MKALAPGDRAQRKVDLRYRGNGRFAAVVLRVKRPSRSLLSSSAGLRLTIDRCSRAWAKRGRTYRCHGRRSVVLQTAPISRQSFRLRRLTARAGRTDHLRLTLSLPPRAGNALQRRTARITYAFTGVAR